MSLGTPPSERDAESAAPSQVVLCDDLPVYGLPEDFSLPTFRGATLIQVAIGEYQVQLWFDGNRGISIEARYAVPVPDGEAEEFTDMPAGAAALTAILGARLQDAAGTSDGTLMHSFATGAKVVIFDDSTQYESYQIHDGERLIVV